MRRLLPLALVLAACAKPEGDKVMVPLDRGPVATTMDLTPESLAKAMDVPLYPGAEAPDGMSSVPKRISDGTTHYSLVLATPDSVDKATAWYTGKLGLSATAGPTGKTMIGKTPKGNDLIITVAREAERTFIRIKSIAYPK